MVTEYRGKFNKCHEVPNFYIEVRKVTNSSEREYWCLKYFGEEITRQQIQRL